MEFAIAKIYYVCCPPGQVEDLAESLPILSLIALVKGDVGNAAAFWAENQGYTSCNFELLDDFHPIDFYMAEDDYFAISMHRRHAEYRLKT